MAQVKRKTKPAEDVVEVANKSTCALKVQGVLIEKGETKPVKNFNPDSAINKAWISAEMIGVKK